MVISMENITVNKEFHELHFDSIQALRGLAALFVVFQHVRFLNFGAFGVDIFFCISGFMIMFTTEKSTKYFFRKRLVRILPLYYLMTLGTYLSLLLFPSPSCVFRRIFIRDCAPACACLAPASASILSSVGFLMK